MALIVTISGSPTTPSRSQFLARTVGDLLARRGFEVAHLDVRALPAQSLLHADVTDPALGDAIACVARAQGIVVATPVYKAAYTGTLKTFLDVLPHRGLEGKIALPIASARLADHSLALDTALKPVLAALGASAVTSGLFVADAEAEKTREGSYVLSPPLRERLEAEAASFARLVRGEGRRG